MARVLVRQAARATQDLMALAQALSGHVDASRRDAFVSHVQSVPGPTLTPRTGGTGGTGAVGGTGSGAVARTAAGAHTMTLAEAPSAADAEAAERALTRHMGPIARVMVKKALASARSRGEFLDTLAGHLQEAKDRARFLAELKR